MDWMLVCFMLPYLGLVGHDASLHPRRRVPVIESILHFCAGIAVSGFLVSSLFGRDGFALVGLLLALPAMFADEWIYHRRVGRYERRIHLGAFLSLVVYVGVWAWTR